MQTPASFGEAERLLKSGVRLTPEHLASLLEQNPATVIPDVLRAYVVGTLRGMPALPAGRRRRRISASLDFLMADAIDLYETKLAEYKAEDTAAQARARKKSDILPRARLSPHERAAEAVLEKMNSEIGKKSVKRLLNLMSEIKWRAFPEEDMVDPEIPDEFPLSNRD
jgi:hypothetical protein